MGGATRNGPVAQEVVDRFEALRARGVVHAGHVDDLLELRGRVVLEEAARARVCAAGEDGRTGGVSAETWSGSVHTLRGGRT